MEKNTCKKKKKKSSETSDEVCTVHEILSGVGDLGSAHDKTGQDGFWGYPHSTNRYIKKKNTQGISSPPGNPKSFGEYRPIAMIRSTLA